MSTSGDGEFYLSLQLMIDEINIFNILFLKIKTSMDIVLMMEDAAIPM